MILTEKQCEEFKELSKPLIKFLNDNFNPHVTIILTPTGGEIMSGSASFQCHEFIKD